MIKFIGVARTATDEYEVVAAETFIDIAQLVKQGVRDIEMVQVDALDESEALAHIAELEMFSDPLGKYAISIRQTELS